ncbi:CopG family transcriptional regulator [Gemmatimonas sp.]|uniref:CopG family transcriptional regulator n=1 Tax=Gemmatimonas sp. TaxID=1962908 RepID=UPI00356B06C8
MTKNVTVTLDEGVARWARITAAELDTSVSRMLGDLLREQMRRRVTYETEMRQYLVREPKPINSGCAAYPSRGDVYDRSDLR